MRTDQLVRLSHLGPATTEGRACIAFLPGGGLYTQDWVALVHEESWALPATFDAELLRLAEESGDTGIMVGCRLERCSIGQSSSPPRYTLAGEIGEQIRLMGNVPSLGDRDAVQRVRRTNELARIVRAVPDPHFRALALSRLRRIGLWIMPSLRAGADEEGTLGSLGSYVDTVVERASELAESGASETVRSAELYWLLRATPAYTPWGKERRID